MNNTGTCPIRSQEILVFALNMLREKGVLTDLPEEEYMDEVRTLGEMMPSHYLPDVYLDLPLMNGRFEGLAMALDSFDRCYLNYASDGEYFVEHGWKAYDEPKDRDIVIVAGRNTATVNAKAYLQNDPSDLDLLKGLAGEPLEYHKEETEEGYVATLVISSRGARKKFRNHPSHGKIVDLLREIGCDEDMLALLHKASFNCGVPYLDGVRGYYEWVACMDVAAIKIHVVNGKVVDCHAVISITDKSSGIPNVSMKPSQAYQWHITDNCDQRCKHCYLFAEDAALHCVTTPWDKLMLTLDEIVKDAERRHAYALPAISGGDPILHPDFWRFVEEIHRRGMRWMILGNPFHLSKEVCERLYELGCVQYQMSMDGLEGFHDFMRKPGSYKATLEALKLLTEAGIQTQLMATVSKQNLDDIIACMDVAVENNVNNFSFARYCATSREKARETYPTPQEYREFLLKYYNKKKAFEKAGYWTNFRMKEHLFTLLQYELGDFKIPEFAKKHPGKVFRGCHLGTNVTICSNGDLMACRRMDSVIGNVSQQPISAIVTSDLCQSYQEVKNIKKCKDCELLGWCRGCRAVGYNATGDLQGEDPCCWKQVDTKD